MGKLMRVAPELDIHILETVTPRLIDELADGRLDTATIALPVFEASLTEVQLFTEIFLLVRPGADGAAHVPSSRTLRDERLLLLEEGALFGNRARCSATYNRSVRARCWTPVRCPRWSRWSMRASVSS